MLDASLYPSLTQMPASPNFPCWCTVQGLCSVSQRASQRFQSHTSCIPVPVASQVSNPETPWAKDTLASSTSMPLADCCRRYQNRYVAMPATVVRQRRLCTHPARPLRVSAHSYIHFEKHGVIKTQVVVQYEKLQDPVSSPPVHRLPRLPSYRWSSPSSHSGAQTRA